MVENVHKVISAAIDRHNAQHPDRLLYLFSRSREDADDGPIIAVVRAEPKRSVVALSAAVCSKAEQLDEKLEKASDHLYWMGAFS